MPFEKVLLFVGHSAKYTPAPYMPCSPLRNPCAEGGGCTGCGTCMMWGLCRCGCNWHIVAGVGRGAEIVQSGSKSVAKFGRCRRVCNYAEVHAGEHISDHNLQKQQSDAQEKFVGSAGLESQTAGTEWVAATNGP